MDAYQPGQHNIPPLIQTGCPHLGLATDEQVRFAYPSNGNVCHLCKPVALVALDYQAAICLTHGYNACPVFESRGQAELPAEARVQRRRRGEGFSRWLVMSLGILLALALVVGGVMAFQGNQKPAQLAVTATQPVLAAATPSAQPSPQLAAVTEPVSLTPTRPAPTATLTPAPSATPTPATPTPGPGLEAPFGPQGEFVLHEVAQAESLSVIAEAYQTTIDVIVATNVFVPGQSLWAGKVLVLLPGRTEAGEYPRFRPIYLEQATRIDQLVWEYGVQVSDLRKYNGLGADPLILGGRWIILPLPPDSQ